MTKENGDNNLDATTGEETDVDVSQFEISDIREYTRQIARGDTVIVFDTTLRDGEQSPGATLNTQEKLDIATQLARLGVDIMEAGFPIASPGDLEAVSQIASTVGRQPRIDKDGNVTAPPIIAGLARANKLDIDKAWEGVQAAVRPRIHTFIATSDIHMESKLRMSRDEVLETVGDTVEYAASLCQDVEFSPEDAGRSDPDFLVRVVSVAIQAGATTINIPDTVGYTTPEEFGGLIQYLRENVPGGEDVVFSVHCHNDLGLATANTLSGLQHGARQMEVTLNGIGERAGNTSLEEAAMAIQVRQPVFGLETNIVSQEIHRASDMVSRYTGMVIQPNKAIVGANAFAHEAGIHQDGMLKNKRTYEIMDASTIGLNQSSLVLGKHSGRHALGRRLEDMGFHLTQEELNEIFGRFKELADKKKTVTDADLEALVGDEIYQPDETWELLKVQVQCGTGVTPTAVVTVRNAKTGEVKTDAGFGTGPVDAVYQGINRVVGVENNLTEFLVQAVTEGIDATGDVTIRIEVPAGSLGFTETAQGRPRRRLFSGRGVDTDIIVACAKAHMQALNKALAAERGESAAVNIAADEPVESLAALDPETLQVMDGALLPSLEGFLFDMVRPDMKQLSCQEISYGTPTHGESIGRRFVASPRGRNKDKKQRGLSALLLPILILALMVSTIQPVLAQTEDSVSASEFAACDALTEEELRSELNTLSQSIFDHEDGIDLDAIVERQWQLHDMDTAVDTAVADAVDVVQRDDEIWNTFLSGWSPAKAEKLAQTVAVVAFDSETFRQALDDLAEGIAADLEDEIAALSAESVTTNLVCLQQFIERNYSTIVVDAFEQGIRDSAGDVDVSANDQLDDGIMSVLNTHKTTLGGVGIIIAAQISRKLVQRIGKVIARRAAGRVAGRLLGRAGAAVIPLAGWVIGGGLIIYDVIDSLDGALPQIEQSLQSAEAKQLIQFEIIQTIEPELRREMPQIAREISNDLYSEWLDFRRQYRQLLAFADKNPTFSEMIAQHGNFTRASLLDAMLATLGADATGATIEDGTFAQFLTMPNSIVDILEITGSPETVLAWYELAGSDLDAVIALELHKLMMPQELTKETLDRLLAVDDKAVIAKLTALDSAAITSLYQLSSATLNELTVRLSAGELETLAVMVDGLDPQRRNQFVSALQQNPNAMHLILENDAGEAVLASRDMTAAIAFLGTPADGYSIAMDAVNVANGSVSLRLFGAKYGGWTTAMLIGVPLLLALALVYSIISLLARPFVGVYRLFARKG